MDRGEMPVIKWYLKIKVIILDEIATSLRFSQ